MKRDLFSKEMMREKKTLVFFDQVTFSYEKEEVLSRLSFEVHKGEFLSIIGPNGSGKTTLIRLLSKVLEPSAGEIEINGVNISRIKRNELAQIVGVVPQDSFINFPFTVFEVVLMGRYPYLGRLAFERREDREIAKRAMVLTDVLYLEGRDINDLSGGERQRVLVARALAQEPEILLLDEFTSSLDLNHKIEIYNLIKRLNMEKSLTVINVSHDLNMASEYADRLLLLHRGEVSAIGKPGEVLKRDIIKEVFECNVLIEESPITGSPQIIPLNSKITAEKQKSLKIHIVSGEGRGSVLMRRLFIKGFEITAGVLNVGDSDHLVGEALGIPMVLEKPFSAISDQTFSENLAMIEKTDLIIVEKFSIGMGNLRNLEAVMEGLKRGKEVLMIENDLEFDFTGGKAKDLYRSIVEKGGQMVKNQKELMIRLDSRKNGVL
jgi:iron complex transport system ATP-binding protein